MEGGAVQGNDFSFFLIHPDEVVDNLGAIGQQLMNAKIFLYLHIGDPVAIDEVKRTLPSSIPALFIYMFHHGSGAPVERFVREIAANHGRYEEEFRLLIEKSLKMIPNQRLKTLLILTIGFLAVQKPEILPLPVFPPVSEGERTTGRTEVTDERMRRVAAVMQKKWWRAALGDDFRAIDLMAELEARGRDNLDSIRRMMEEVNTLEEPDGSFPSERASKFTEVMEIAYKDLRDLLL